MDLDTAQRISLIQRNLESAQVAIDSAVELLRVVMESGFGDGRQTIITRAEPVPALPALPPATTKRGRPKKTARANGSLSTKPVAVPGRGLGPSPATRAILGVFEHNPDTVFDYPTLEHRLRAKGTVIPKDKIRDACNNLAARGSLERIETGRFKLKAA